MNTRNIACLLALLPLLASAEVYKWVDANGKVQYSDQPPPGGKAATVKIPVNTAVPVTAPANPTPAPGKDKEATANKGEPKVSPEEAQRNCSKVTAQIKEIEASDFIINKDAQGREYDMTDAQTKSQLDTMRKDQTYWCSKVKK
ncbi:DUF4124 domain-containing protein [Chitinimonas sp.]|uniref:DUF4124 domain-containing protein n=1 Tax=Chitinimonas sp. TaxID=1934313 RepID=UPI002F953767